MAITDYEDRIKELVDSQNHNEFIYDFLEVYDKIAKSTITKLRKGSNNLSKKKGEVYLKNKLYFKEVTANVLTAFSSLEDKINEIKSKPRYIIVTNYQQLLAKDTQTADTLDIEFKELPKYFDFFLAWNGIEKVDFEKENPADIKAAERFIKLFDELLKNNEKVDRHSLNLFLIRVLFCMFAEDTGIFDMNIFTNFIKTMTAIDGSDMNDRIAELFAFLDKKNRNDDEPAYLTKFPYVNGQLFTEPHMNLNFSPKARKLIIDAGELISWAKVNPDILGSMLQAVATEDKRSHLGMHYTSVPNIMKVIKPLFLDNLREEFEVAKGNEVKLNALLTRMGKIKFMDPACGSGNFLIITYKELRRLEMDILSELININPTTMYIPAINLSQFYGIEIEDFAVDVTRLSLWIADHQMNTELSARFNDFVKPTLPLQQAGDIHCGNALRLEWKKILPHKKNDEVYLFGNPPYLGSSLQSTEQKYDMESILSSKLEGYKKLDYVSGWFMKGIEYTKESRAKLAFVSTNSIIQGEQVPILWKYVLKTHQIDFGYTSFSWNNNAKGNAAVIVVIIGISDKINNTIKKLFYKNSYKIVENISPYLTDTASSTIVEKANKSISGLPIMYRGNMPTDGGGLILKEQELDNVPDNCKKFIHRFIGSQDSLNGEVRYVLWISEKEYNLIKDEPFIRNRISIVEEMRRKSKKKSTNKLAETPWRFEFISHPENYTGNTLLIPRVSSINRKYMPMSLINSEDIVSDTAVAIYNAPIYLFGLLESKMHMVWLKNIGGKLKNDYRYSSDLVYNTFPIPQLSARRINEIEQIVFEILDIREEEGATLAELYGSPYAERNPKPMNARLLDAHEKLDAVVERAYKERGNFKDDNERLSLLLDMYQEKVMLSD